MTVDEMIIGVQLGVQKVDSNAYNNLLDEEIEWYLNEAIDKFIKLRFGSGDNQAGFEQSQIRIDDLRTLVTNSDDLDTVEQAVPFKEGVSADSATLPADHMFLLRTSALVQYNQDGVSFTLSNDKRTITGTIDTDYKELKVPCKFMQQDDVQQVISDPFNKMDIKTPIFTIVGDEVHVFTDNTFIVDKVNTTYIKEPAKVDSSGGTDCDLAESTHQDIVELAVRIILGDILKN